MNDEDGIRGPARVTETGLGVVHAGEIILPAAGSEAQAEQVMDDARTYVQYVFPVEIEVAAGSQPIDPDALADLVLTRLAQHLQNSQGLEFT